MSSLSLCNHVVSTAEIMLVDRKKKGDSDCERLELCQNGRGSLITVPEFVWEWEKPQNTRHTTSKFPANFCTVQIRIRRNGRCSETIYKMHSSAFFYLYQLPCIYPLSALSNKKGP
jgi:hypothetical protein